MVNKEIQELLEKIIEVSSTSRKDNSILYNFSIFGRDVECNISVVEQNGEKNSICKFKFCSDRKFYDMITPILKAFNEHNDVVFSDFVDVNQDNIVTFRLLTDTNDQFTLDGLTFEDAYYIKDILNSMNSDTHIGKSSSDFNDSGKVNIGLIFIIILLVIFIAGFVYFF